MADHCPGRVAHVGRRVLGVNEPDDRKAALLAVELLKAFFRSLGLPVTFAQLDIPKPDIKALVAKLHQNKGREIGGYYRLTATDTEQIYTLAL